MGQLLIASYDMEVGGVERSLAGLLDHLDYDRYDVDLMLYRHSGDFMSLLSDRARLLGEVPEYATFRASIGETFRSGYSRIGLTRLLSRAHAELAGRLGRIAEPGYIQQQLMWSYALPFLPRHSGRYKAAISYLWPHYFVAEKVEADVKIAWIHTDYSTIAALRKLDLRMWRKFDYIVAVSEACRSSFLQVYGELEDRVIVMENLIAPDTIRLLTDEQKGETDNPMLQDNRFKLLTVGRLSHAKGIDNAVRALSLLKKRGYDEIAWYVVGYGGDEGMIRALIQEFGLEDSFILLGKQSNPYPYMQACDLYVQPSRYEGKAVTVIEAQILCKPVLITDYPTAHSQVMSGYDGCIADNTVEGIADGIERLYRHEELRARLSHNCQGLQFDNEQELEKLYQLLEGKAAMALVH
ncbi:glycosyltransferase [Paenibacillus sp. J5C_2022]|uniref:glycosyltransferase n=1 Tax=Paenibacillus sp. J5C2022 TaxID=2977129 RepID=UPI0021CEFD92|nr:glycosyltransferase [Paenibacillus sp. J5C2022]MCU6710296.1 glycosyltransferase [Paenibacillus sp. J5C2022]